MIERQDVRSRQSEDLQAQSSKLGLALIDLEDFAIIFDDLSCGRLLRRGQTSNFGRGLLVHVVFRICIHGLQLYLTNWMIIGLREAEFLLPHTLTYILCVVLC